MQKFEDRQQQRFTRVCVSSGIMFRYCEFSVSLHLQRPLLHSLDLTGGETRHSPSM